TTFFFLTATASNGPALGPTSAAEGPMIATNRKADPTQSAPHTMCRVRSTIMTPLAASMRLEPPCYETGIRLSGSTNGMSTTVAVRAPHSVSTVTVVPFDDNSLGNQQYRS